MGVGTVDYTPESAVGSIILLIRKMSSRPIVYRSATQSDLRSIVLVRCRRRRTFSARIHQGKHILAAAHYLKVVERCKTQPSIDQAAIVEAAHKGLAKLVPLVRACVQYGRRV